MLSDGIPLVIIATPLQIRSAIWCLLPDSGFHPICTERSLAMTYRRYLNIFSLNNSEKNHLEKRRTEGTILRLKNRLTSDGRSFVKWIVIVSFQDIDRGIFVNSILCYGRRHISIRLIILL